MLRIHTEAPQDCVTVLDGTVQAVRNSPGIDDVTARILDVRLQIVTACAPDRAVRSTEVHGLLAGAGDV